MITKWKLANFKSVRDRTELALAPLTVFSGPNSSGKSTVIQSMLLISQTLASKVPSRSVVLNGHLTKLGQFDDLRSFGSGERQIEIGWDCRPSQSRPRRVLEGLPTYRSKYPLYRSRLSQMKYLSCQIAFEVDPDNPQRDLMQLQPRLFSSILCCSTKDESGADSTSKMTVRRTTHGLQEKLARLKVVEPDVQLVGSLLDYDVELDQESLKDVREEIASANPSGCWLRHFLPERLLVQYDHTDEDARLIASAICDEEGVRYRAGLPRYWRDEDITLPASVTDFLRAHLGDEFRSLFESNSIEVGDSRTFQPIASLRDWKERVRKLPATQRTALRRTLSTLSPHIRRAAKAGRTNQYALAPTRLPSDLLDAVNYLDQVFSNSVRYLGPLRDEPKALYPLSPTVDPADVGLRGEFTAAVLDLHRGRQINYIPSASFNGDSVKTDPTTASLETAVLDWLQYMGVADRLETRDRGKLGHELKVVTSGVNTPHDLTHVGVGVSQILPILVMCLLAESDTTVVLEQPEIHLHPRVQTMLADFFLSMALLGKQCIVETHSEYLINRLRLRVASSHGDDFSSITKIYFAEKRSGVSCFREVAVNRYGAITDWPEGFFDQSQRESEDILRAAVAKRKRERTEAPIA